jgi:predicted porin
VAAVCTGVASAQGIIPEQPFAAEVEGGSPPSAASSDPATPPIANSTIDLDAATDSEVTSSTADAVVRKSASSDHFSLWDFFSQFFQFGAPGDPNHPDKLRLTIGPTVGYDDNVLTTKTDPIASETAGLNGTLTYSFGSERLKIDSSAALGTTYYDNRPGDDTDYNASFSLATSYFVTRRLQLSGNVAFAYLSQPNPTLIGGVQRFSGDYTTTNLGFGLSYSLRPRLSMRLQYRMNSIAYTDETQNQSLGFTEQNYILGLDYLLTPRFTLTAEYRYNPLSYDAADQDSTGQILTFGFGASFAPKFQWNFQAGAEARMLNNTTTPDSPSSYIGPFVESDLSYGFAPGSTLVGTLRYGTEPSGSAGISIRQTLRGSLSLQYAFAARLSGNVAISYEHDHYDQPGDTNDFSQEYYTASLGLTYQFNPALALTAGYSYSTVQSDIEADGYTRGITTLGLQIIF